MPEFLPIPMCYCTDCTRCDFFDILETKEASEPRCITANTAGIGGYASA